MPAKHISKRPRLFRTYLTQNPGYDALKIWEAARATSAAPRFFEQITIGDPGLQEQFMDGGMGCNNPVRILVEEAGQEFDCEDKVACIISIGTGIPKVIAVDKPGFFQKVFPSQLIKALADITTSSESEAAAMEERYRSCPGLYHRLNVDRGLEEISLEEWEKLGDVKTHTEAYINDNPDVSRTIDKIVDALVGKETQNYTLGKLGT
jgi:patatin-like phospholipase/acyl hydrolase